MTKISIQYYHKCGDYCDTIPTPSTYKDVMIRVDNPNYIDGNAINMENLTVKSNLFHTHSNVWLILMRLSFILIVS